MTLLALLYSPLSTLVLMLASSLGVSEICTLTLLEIGVESMRGRRQRLSIHEGRLHWANSRALRPHHCFAPGRYGECGEHLQQGNNQQSGKCPPIGGPGLCQHHHRDGSQSAADALDDVHQGGGAAHLSVRDRRLGAGHGGHLRQGETSSERHQQGDKHAQR